MAALTITSEKNITREQPGKLFAFLSDFKNFKAILPADKVDDFTYSEQQCSFNIKGITPMTIRIKDKKEFDFILFSSEGLAKFNFELKVNFIDNPLEAGQCQVELFADLNPFIKTMAEKPLTALVNTMSLKLSQLNPGDHAN